MMQITNRLQFFVLTMLSTSTCMAMAPMVLTVTPVKRTSAQIMQGQVPAPIAPQPLPTPGTGTPGIPTVTNHFTAANYQETGQYGPSGESSVGSKQVLLACKGRIRSFLKDGRIDNVLNLSHDSFFSPITQGGFTADPNVIFHPIWKQWIIFAGSFLPGSLVLAISDSDPITPSTVWSFYLVDTVTNADALGAPAFSASSFFDYATLGADANAIYCAGNILDYNSPNFFVSAAAYVIPKSSLTGTGPATIYAWRSLTDLGPNEDITPFTFQPALNFNLVPDAGYFPSIDLGDATVGVSSRYILNKVTFGVDGVPSFLDPIEVPVAQYVLPLNLLPKSAIGTPESHSISPVASFRLAPTHIRNNSLWLVNNIAVDNTGESIPPALPPSDGGLMTRDAARFTQIDITQLDTDPEVAVLTQGTLFQATETNDVGARSFLTPSIMSNAQGDVLIAATTTAADERLNAAVAQLIENNSAVGEPVLYTNSVSDYNATEDWEFNPLARWGDHTRVSPDPADPAAFWTVQQWCSDTNTWGLEVGRVIANK